MCFTANLLIRICCDDMKIFRYPGFKRAQEIVQKAVIKVDRNIGIGYVGSLFECLCVGIMLSSSYKSDNILLLIDEK